MKSAIEILKIYYPSVDDKSIEAFYITEAMRAYGEYLIHHAAKIAKVETRVYFGEPVDKIVDKDSILNIVKKLK